MRNRVAQILLLLGFVFWTSAVTSAYQPSLTPPDLTPLWVGGFLCVLLAFLADSVWFGRLVERVPFFRPPTAAIASVIGKGNALKGMVRKGEGTPLDQAWLDATDAWWKEAEAVVAKHAPLLLPGFQNTVRSDLTYRNVPGWAQDNYGSLQARIAKLSEIQDKLTR
jgi:hypothetical protein